MTKLFLVCLLLLVCSNAQAHSEGCFKWTCDTKDLAPDCTQEAIDCPKHELKASPETDNFNLDSSSDMSSVSITSVPVHSITFSNEDDPFLLKCRGDNQRMICAESGNNFICYCEDNSKSSERKLAPENTKGMSCKGTDPESGKFLCDCPNGAITCTIHNKDENFCYCEESK